MSTLTKLRHSREAWKKKARERAATIRYQRKEHQRITREREQYKRLARTTAAQLEKERQTKRAPLCKKTTLIHVSLQLFLTARISFRAVSRVLVVLRDILGLRKVPCPQTVINWVNRLSLARVRQRVRLEGTHAPGVRDARTQIWMLDISIGAGAGKMLAVLALPTHHHAVHEGAPTMKQVTCLAVAVAPTWPGDAIAEFLQRVIAVTGRPAAYLKDGGTNLAKAVRILEQHAMSSPCIDDLSHVTANVLKHEYATHPMLETFLSICGQVSTRFKQTLLACLAPPKVSSKARFMNLHRLVTWAKHILTHSPQGGAAQGSVLAQLRQDLGTLPTCRTFITRFLRDATPLLACQKLLKTQGLTQTTYEECKTLMEAIPPQSPVRKGVMAWADTHLTVAAQLGVGTIGLPITSDSIESVFGVAKTHGAGVIKDVTRIALRLPAITGTVTKEDVQQVLSISIKDLHAVLDAHPSLTKQRRDILPHPGRLEELRVSEPRPCLELIPGTKNRSKNVKTPQNSTDSQQSTGPPMASVTQVNMACECQDLQGIS